MIAIHIPIRLIHKILITIKIELIHSEYYRKILRKEFWHRGIVTEAGKAVIEQVKKDGLPYL